MPSFPSEYIMTALNVAPGTPMQNTAIGVCELRGQNPFDAVYFMGQGMSRWQGVVAESMMIYSIARETAR
jgi:hypothetical protein